MPPGIDLERFALESADAWRLAQRHRIFLGTDELLVLFVGTGFRRNGLDDLLPAIGAGMRLAVVGKGERVGHIAGGCANCAWRGECILPG